MISQDASERPKTPWHIWPVGILALIWNGAGAGTIFLAQLGRLPGITADEAAYYAAQAGWFIAVTDIAVLSAMAGAIALLRRSRWAVLLFMLSILCIGVTAAWDLGAGTSRMFANQGALIATLVIWLLAALELWYALAMRRRGILR